MGDKRIQFNNYISEDTVRGFREVISRKYGLYSKNQWSYELERLLRFYISVGGRIPFTAHTQKIVETEKVIVNTYRDKGVQMATTSTAIVTKAHNEGEDYHKRPPQEDPILRPWYLRKGIDLSNVDSVISHLTDEDYRAGDLKGDEAKQWRKNNHDRLAAKLRRIYDNNRIAKQSKRDSLLESELGEIKRHLIDTDSIGEQNKVHVEQIYKAYVVVTDKRDDRPFKRRLHEYIDAGFLAPLDDKYKKFRAEEKLLKL